MLNTKDIIEKALGSLLVAAVIGTCTLFYNEVQTYNEIKELLEVRSELENGFNNEVKSRKNIDDAIIKRLNKIEYRLKKDSSNIKYNREWVNYWVSLRN